MNLVAQIQERLKGILPELLGIQLVEVTPDKVLATLKVRPELCTTGKILHGGTIMAFADTLEPNSSEAILVFEHTWARPLRDAIVNSGGVLANNFRVPGLVVDELLAELAALDES